MSSSVEYSPGPAAGAQIKKDGENWTLVLVRELHHPPERVWEALTDPNQLREWAPYDADRDLGTPGPATLTTVGAPAEHVTKTEVTRAERPKLLEFNWGGAGDIPLRWELEPSGAGTRLTLWHSIGKNFVAMGAAGWHVCLYSLGQMLDGHPVGRTVGVDALKNGEWQRLNAEYAEQFGVDPKLPSW